MLGLTTVYMLEDSKVFVPAVYFSDFWTIQIAVEQTGRKKMYYYMIEAKSLLS